MGIVTGLEQQAEDREREASALRKLAEATRDLGEERVAAILAPLLNGNGNGHAGQGFVLPPPVLAPSEPREGLPRGREAVRLIVRERPGVWALSDLRAEMKRRGWFTSNKGLDVAVTRLAASGEARRVGKGRYEFFGPGERSLL